MLLGRLSRLYFSLNKTGFPGESMKSLLTVFSSLLMVTLRVHAGEPVDISEGRQFWSFQPVRKVEPPTVKDSAWARTPIDRFVLAKIEEAGLTPVAAADARTLIRRMAFDLTGLPPTPDEVTAFVKAFEKSRQSAVEGLIDRLLASPRYGEAQARHWLDIARYAEDQAHTFGVKPSTNAYRYRDWVIDAFNNDMPYDRFVKLQIAADLMDDGSAEASKHNAALGLFGLGAVYYKSSNPAKAIAEELDDKIDTLTRGFLGLTIACARCHDHKFDPIPTQDYYSLAGVFASSKMSDVSMASKDEMAKYQEGQKKVQAVESKAKALFQVEKDKLINTRMDELVKYFLAAWKLEAQRLKKADTAPNEIAKADKLDGGSLDRMNKFLNKKNNPALDGWVKNMPKPGATTVPTPEVIKAAEQFRDAVKAALGNTADKTKADMVQALFGDKGVFVISENEVISKMTPDCKQQYEALKKEQDAVAKAAPGAPPAAHGIMDSAPMDLKIAVRGNPLKPGDIAPRRFLRVLTGDAPALFTKGSGRLELAEAIADAKNPLTARVMANRLWQQHFGRGIVGTPSNFGKLGEAPTHPELLDYLATRLVGNGWSIKKLHREILLSAAYQASAATDPEAMETDPDNRLLWHMQRQRLQVEEFRDALLSVSGKLDLEMGGKTINLEDGNNFRRTVYARVSRHELSGLLRLFDFPDANITSDRRSETTVPQQQLFVLNSEFMILQAKAFAVRMQKAGNDDPARIRHGYELAYGRVPSTTEVAIGQAFLSAQDAADDAAKNKLTRWERYAQALLAGNEFMYVD